MSMSVNAGINTMSMLSDVSWGRAMATALMAWFNAPAPTTLMSNDRSWRSKVTIAAATELGLERADTLMVSTEQVNQTSVRSLSLQTNRDFVVGIEFFSCHIADVADSAGDFHSLRDIDHDLGRF